MNSQAAQRTERSVSPTVQSIEAIQQSVTRGDFPAALRAVNERLASNPTDAEALYIAAVCYRYTDEFTAAQRALDLAKPIAADKGRVYQEQGHLHLAQANHQQALAAYANACQLNPALLASWAAQQKLLLEMGQINEARQAGAQVERLRRMPKVLVAVTDLLAQGKLKKAESLCRKFLRARPNQVEAMRLLADIATQFGEYADAEYLLESAAEFAPDDTQVQIDLIGILRRQQKFSRALERAKALLATDPANPQFQSLVAIETMQSGDFDAAIMLFNKVLETLPDDAITLTSRGHALKTAGLTTEAIASYRLAIEHNPWHGEAYYSLSNLKTYRFDETQLKAMLELEGRDELSPSSREHISFALGKALEDRDEFAQAFDFYQHGNRLKRQASHYDAQAMSRELIAQRNFFSTDVLARGKSAGCPSDDPIFIVGLPRAGSTLLEQILASHSLVDGTLELPNILAMAQQLRRRYEDKSTLTYPEILGEVPDSTLHALGQQYLDDTRIHRREAPRFIDKMPNNFRHIGLIKLILPNARIIDARRHPMACCFSAFKQLFAEGQEFSYDLRDIGQYYNDYVALMDHWDSVSPGAILRVNYEDVVQNLESEVNRLLDFCGLEAEPACISFYDTQRPVRTASSEQVRQPIYDSGVEQWKHFRPYLGELEQVLAESIARYEQEVHISH